jgi:hypothetical protein
MSVKRFGSSDWVTLLGWALAAGLLGSSPAIAQAPGQRGDDLLDQARRAQAVAAQRLESQVRDALLDAQRLSARDSARAIERLRDALSLLEADSVLTERRREALKRVLKDRIRVTEAESDRAAKDAVERNESRALTDSRRSEDDRQAADQAAITQALANIRELRSAGRLEEANRLANDLANRYPASPVAQSSRRSASILEQVATQRQMRADRERRIAAVGLDVQRSATPPAGDVEYPKDWAEKTRNRTKSLNPLTAKEKAILLALNTPITVNFKNSRFEDVIEYLATLLRQPILLDRNALEEAQVTYDTLVTVNVKGLGARTLLRKILSDFGLTYVVKDETIQVVSAAKAKDMMVTRSYYLGDLIAGQGNGFFFGAGGFDQVQTVQNIARIIEMIQTSVEPQSWQVNGGQGTISFNAATLSLVVRQSAEIHGMIGSSLYP